jgi:hypothetical protein
VRLVPRAPRGWGGAMTTPEDLGPLDGPKSMVGVLRAIARGEPHDAGLVRRLASDAADQLVLTPPGAEAFEAAADDLLLVRELRKTIHVLEQDRDAYEKLRAAITLLGAVSFDAKRIDQNVLALADAVEQLRKFVGSGAFSDADVRRTASFFNEPLTPVAPGWVPWQSGGQCTCGVPARWTDRAGFIRCNAHVPRKAAP